MNNKIIQVTRPNLPPIEKLTPYLEQIWESKILTNGGPIHQQLEVALCKYLNVPYISLFTNATIALITALKALKIQGEVITTPYSFVATAHSLVWNDLKPIFVDINPITLNIETTKIEEAITPNTKAIMPVHVYGNPCDVVSIDSIAKKYNLRVIYDAAHAFGVECHCGSLLNHGDLSVLSFHATKVFNTFEGGAIVCQNFETKKYIDNLKNFGITNETTVVEVGINGKMSELNAAIGVLQLQHIDEEIDKRKKIDNSYREGLKNVRGIRCHEFNKSHRHNYNYFPIFVEKEYQITRDQLYEKLKSKGVYARRYFFPLITEFPLYKTEKIAAGSLDVAQHISQSVICLPLYSSLKFEEVSYILDIIGSEQ